MPGGVPIVNDLTTGGANKALSAEMGKQLGQRVPELYYEQKNALAQAANKHSSSWWPDFGKVVNILHFSDIHGDAVNLGHVVAFKESVAGLYALFTGDMVNDNWDNGIAHWAGTAGAEKIMVAIGNHDTKYNGNWYGKNAADCYGRYISPFVSNWDVISQADVCYYYKDWSTEKLRLIVLDVMHWDATQAAWLVNTLAGAKTAGLHVICSGHCTPGTSDSGTKGCPFDSVGVNYSAWEAESYGKMNSAAPSAVQDFIDAGGHFVCWLTGHTHADMFRHLASYPKQLYCAVACSGINDHVTTGAGGLLLRQANTPSEDLFNLVSINATRQTLTIVRVGADRDTIGRHIGTVVYDYANNEILNCD